MESGVENTVVARSFNVVVNAFDMVDAKLALKHSSEVFKK